MSDIKEDFDGDVQQVKLPMPFALKKQLVDDWEVISLLVKLFYHVTYELIDAVCAKSEHYSRTTASGQTPKKSKRHSGPEAVHGLEKQEARPSAVNTGNHGGY